jgi:hypothetical protein
VRKREGIVKDFNLRILGDIGKFFADGLRILWAAKAAFFVRRRWFH